MEKVCIVGAGAIGGYLGAKLALAGVAQVSALARGATLAALHTQGWRLREDGSLRHAEVHASDDPAALGVQDLVIVAVKGPALAGVCAALPPLLGPHTIVLPAMNGVPWWFGQGVAALGDAPLRSIDPDGRIGATIALPRVLGGVVHLAASCPEPGLVEHRMGRALIVGEPAGGTSERAARAVALLRAAGLDASESADIRREVWFKLWGNLTINPVTAITGATADRVLDDPLVRGFCSAAMREAAVLGARLGCAIEQSPEDRHAVTRKLGAFRSSMLQDVQAGRPIELDAIVGVVHELSQRLGVPTPTIDALFGLARLFGRVHGLYPD